MEIWKKSKFPRKFSSSFWIYINSNSQVEEYQEQIVFLRIWQNTKIATFQENRMYLYIRGNNFLDAQLKTIYTSPTKGKSN